MAAVYNRHHKNAPTGAVYIGRGSPWGNPFVVGRDGDRETVIRRFAEEVLPSLDIERLRGKDLICYCKPAACHGDVILKALQSKDDK
jgi:hypothetical protein